MTLSSHRGLRQAPQEIEIMVSKSAVPAESGSQRMSMISRIKSVKASRLPSSQRGSQKRQNTAPADYTIRPPLPVAQQSKKSEKSENNTSNSRPSDPANWKRVQYRSSPVQEANQPTQRSGLYASPPVRGDKPVSALLTDPDTTDGGERHTNADIELAQGQIKRSGASKSHPSPINVGPGEGAGDVSRGGPNKIQKLKPGITGTNGAIQSITTRIQRYARRASKLEDSIASTSTTRLSSRGDQPRYSEAAQHGNKDVSTAVGYVGSSQPTSADAKVTEQTATESEEIKKLRQDLYHSRSQIAELKRRCEAQSKDLESSNTFLNTADKSSDSDVINVLQRLNAEAQQNTTYMADYLAESFEFINSTTSQTKEQISAVQRASGHVGPVLMKSLETKTIEDIPMLLQIAFQAYLASVLCETASSWAFEPGQNAFINGIYQRLRRVEAQAISGRWRTLARVNTVHNWVTHPESLVKAIITDICDILLAAGCTAPQSDMISKVTSKFEEKIALLVELAGRLNRMFDEVISSDFEAFVARPGEKFDGERMEKDSDDGQAGIQAAPVLCTTHLGLIKRMPVGTLWERGKKRKMIVFKAKVLLESFLATED